MHRIDRPAFELPALAIPSVNSECPRRESNPHLRFRKPLFYPLNYGDDDLEGIDELNGDGQGAVAMRSDFSRAGFALDYGQLSRDYISFA